MNPSRAPRLVFLDWMRAVSILLMIETHAFNLLLKPTLKVSDWFHMLNFFNGFVAPTFLFVSGWSFVVASSRKLADFRSFGPLLRLQLQRIGLIWILGYALHLPGFAFSVLRSSQEDSALQALLRVDILHCIAAGLLLLLAARVWTKSEIAFEQAVWICAIIFVFLAPCIWKNASDDWTPKALIGYLSERNLSLFPLFPWLGFLLAGGGCGMRFARAESTGSLPQFMRWTAVSATFLIVVGYWFSRRGFPWPYGTDTVRSHPAFFALRLGYVLLCLWVCWQLQHQKFIQARWLMTLSRESLLIYVSHILILFRVPGEQINLVGRNRGSLSAWECLTVTCCTVVLAWILARSWNWTKSRHGERARQLSFVAGLGAVLLFFAR